MSKTVTILQMSKGKVVNLKSFANFLISLKDGRHLIEASEVNKRSNNQNNYYWLMLTEYVQPALYEQGWGHIKNKEAAHEFVADLFLKVKEVNTQTGEMKERVRSTTELSKTEFNAYLEEIWQWAAEYLSINIPSPNQQLATWE